MQPCWQQFCLAAAGWSGGGEETSGSDGTDINASRGHKRGRTNKPINQYIFPNDAAHMPNDSHMPSDYGHSLLH